MTAKIEGQVGRGFLEWDFVKSFCTGYVCRLSWAQGEHIQPSWQYRFICTAMMFSNVVFNMKEGDLGIMVQMPVPWMLALPLHLLPGRRGGGHEACSHQSTAAHPGQGA